MVTIEDCVEAEEIVKADKGIQTLLKERYGITDMNMVAADPWFYGDRFGEHPNLHHPCGSAKMPPMYLSKPLRAQLMC